MGELFADFERDREAFEPRRNGAPVPLEPPALEVLGHLVAHPGRLVTKEEILDEVWGNRFVSEAALSGPHQGGPPGARRRRAGPAPEPPDPVPGGRSGP